MNNYNTIITDQTNNWYSNGGVGTNARVWFDYSFQASNSKYEKVKFDDVKNDIKNNYEKDVVTITSNHLDIIASYLSCQKVIYMEASHFVCLRLNYLMIPTILIATSCSVLPE